MSPIFYVVLTRVKVRRYEGVPAHDFARELRASLCVGLGTGQWLLIAGVRVTRCWFRGAGDAVCKAQREDGRHCVVSRSEEVAALAGVIEALESVDIRAPRFKLPRTGHAVALSGILVPQHRST